MVAGMFSEHLIGWSVSSWPVELWSYNSHKMNSSTSQTASARQNLLILAQSQTKLRQLESSLSLSLDSRISTLHRLHTKGGEKGKDSLANRRYCIDSVNKGQTKCCMTSTDEKLMKLKGHTDNVRALLLSPDGTTVR